MSKFTDAIDSIRPLAESRGFQITPQSINGEISVLLIRTNALVKRKYYAFSGIFDTKDFLEKQPEIPRRSVRVTYMDGVAEVLDVRAWKTQETMTRAADAAERRRPGSGIKALVIG